MSANSVSKTQNLYYYTDKLMDKGTKYGSILLVGLGALAIVSSVFAFLALHNHFAPTNWLNHFKVLEYAGCYTLLGSGIVFAGVGIVGLLYYKTLSKERIYFFKDNNSLERLVGLMRPGEVFAFKVNDDTANSYIYHDTTLHLKPCLFENNEINDCLKIGMKVVKKEELKKRERLLQTVKVITETDCVNCEELKKEEHKKLNYKTIAETTLVALSIVTIVVGLIALGSHQNLFTGKLSFLNGLKVISVKASYAMIGSGAGVTSIVVVALIIDYKSRKSYGLEKASTTFNPRFLRENEYLYYKDAAGKHVMYKSVEGTQDLIVADDKTPVIPLKRVSTHLLKKREERWGMIKDRIGSEEIE